MKTWASMRRLELVKDRPDCEVAFEVLERLLDRHQQQIMAPQLGRILFDEVGVQQISAFAQSGLPQFIAIEFSRMEFYL
jgi:hypothetical protein